MVLVSRDELQQLIGASVRCAFEEYQQVQAPQDTSEYYTIRQLAEKWGVSIATIWRHEKLDIDGVILTKLDGDTRGGAGPVRPAVYYEPQFEPGRLNTLLEGILTRDIVFAPHRDILYAHKRIGGRDVYFVTNDTDRAQSVKLSFPGARKLELWNPQNGEVGPLAASSELTLRPYEGMIVRRIK